MIDPETAVGIGRRYYNLFIKDKDYEKFKREIFSKYKAHSSAAITMNKRPKEIEKIFKLEEMMFFCNAEDKDYESVLTYLLVVVNSIKHNLDYRKAKADLHITELKNKYRRQLETQLGIKGTVIGG